MHKQSFAIATLILMLYVSSVCVRQIIFARLISFWLVFLLLDVVLHVPTYSIINPSCFKIVISLINGMQLEAYRLLSP